MKQLSGLRKAVAGVDDTTLTRWIKEPTRHTSGRKTAPMAVDATGTRFKSRVLPVAGMTNLLVSGHSNVKIGRDVRKGALRGYWIYTLSLEERATCPRSCAHWRDCFGNAMPFAKRIDHTDPDFLPRLEAEIERLLSIRGRPGILIRLHALGDFYSARYVDFWWQMLLNHPRLAIYGYTARLPENYEFVTGIGDHIQAMNKQFGTRCMIRFSNAGFDEMSTVGITDAAAAPSNSFVCPEQTGKTLACATCAACWSTTKNVAFLDH